MFCFFSLSHRLEMDVRVAGFLEHVSGEECVIELKSLKSPAPRMQAILTMVQGEPIAQ